MSPLKCGVLWAFGVVGFAWLSAWVCAEEGGARADAPTPFAQEKSTGVSRQVVVYSRDREARQRVVSGAEDTKRALLEVLGLPDGWQLPVIVTLRAESAFVSSSSKPAYVEVPGGTKIEMALPLPASTGEGAFREEFARAFLLEIACRNIQANGAGKVISMPPAWLIDGVLALEEFRKGEGDALLYQAVVRSGFARDPRSWLDRDPALLDTTSRAVYRLASAGLVQALIEQPEGAAGIVALLRAGVGSETSDPFDRIFEAYPSLNKSLASLVKRWSIQLARFAATGDIDLKGAGPTEEVLAGALRIPGSEPGKTCGPEELVGLRDKVLVRDRCEMLSEHLKRIYTRAHPLYVPVIRGYLELFKQMSVGKAKNAGKRLEELAGVRSGIVQVADAIDDHLNWIEANAPGVASGAFDKYLAEAGRSEKRQPRTDPVTRYLDALEAEMR